ncbi:hypothetical protein CesoFtcFv8_020080 [Champsocephalus esox]|uniref:BPTI/Kunitz inhibitor domain-containing protein n=1 Tax=Champsocephalus esox TaxID=159716 RepID=A0AAN8BFE1_9TELE|nr:hypothetical protein CesoFtcFv8_020080 [Champsocephalus esox]
MEFCTLALFTLFSSFYNVLALSPKAVKCLLQVDEGPCRADLERYYYNTITQKFPKEEGTCRALFSRYFFNMTTMQCEPFYYGGCQGNSNRFQDLTSCKEYCSPKKSVPVLCLDPLDKGSCSASIPRFYYNTATKMCDEFIYSGCGGSSNNFVTRQSCMDVCARRGKKLTSQVKGRRKRRNRNNRITFLQA